MGMSPTQLIIIAVIVLLLFGTKKLRNIGGDLGSAVKGFKKAMSEDATKTDKEAEKESDDQFSKSLDNQDAAAKTSTETKDKDKA